MSRLSLLGVGGGAGDSLNNGLVAVYHFDNNLQAAVGGVDLTNLSTGVNYVGGKKEQAIESNNGGIAFRDNSLITGLNFDFSVGCWVNLKEEIVSNIGILGFGSTTGNAAVLFFLTVGNRLNFQFYGGNGSLNTPLDTFLVNTWTSFVLTMQNKVAKIFINGSLAAQRNITNDYSIGNGYSSFLNITKAVNTNYNFKLDECHFWNRALTEEECERFNTKICYPF